jgi:cytochrome c-type biogenesis protein CcmH/NrfG
VAQQLEKEQKTKQAIAAYQQVVRLFPNTPEATNALQRIFQAQRDAVQRASNRPRQ